jgi:hypothetical protein
MSPEEWNEFIPFAQVSRFRQQLRRAVFFLTESCADLSRKTIFMSETVLAVERFPTQSLYGQRYNALRGSKQVVG